MLDTPAAAAAPAVPLRYRLPNTPPLFVGRAEETAQLAAMIGRAPVSVIRGLGGIGKTSLVLHTLHQAFRAQAQQTLFIGLRPAEPPVDPTVEIMRAVAAAHGLDRVEWAGLLEDPDALLQTLIDGTEARGAWVVLDDLHHADAARAQSALAALARYARATRWIITTRVDPEVPELADQTLALGGMAAADLDTLAARCAPDRSRVELRQAALASAGSPWNLRQILAGGDRRSAAEDLLVGLPAAAVALLETLALLDLPLAARALAAVVPLPAPEVIEALERRGIIERGAGGLRLHDVARPLIGTGADLRERKARAARALAGAEDPTAALEALRLTLDLGRIEEAATLLETRFELMLAAGLAPRLHELLASLERPCFDGFRLRCAVELGEAAALDAAPLPDSPSRSDRLFWALSRFLRGKLAETATIAAEVRRDAPAPLALEAGILEAVCLGEQGHVDEALAVLDALAAGWAEATARRELHRARWLTQQGRVGDAMGAVERLLAIPVDPASACGREVREELVVVLCFLGRIRKLEHALAALGLGAPLGPVALFGFRRALLTEVLLGIHQGRLEDARAIFREVKPLTLQTVYLRSFVCALEVELRLAVGELGGLAELVVTLHAEATRTGHAQNRAFAVVAAHRLAILRGSARVVLGGPGAPVAPVAPVTPVTPGAPVTPFWAATCAATARLHAILHGLAPPPVPALAEAIVFGRVVCALARSAERALAGDAEGARLHASSACAAAAEHGHVPGELDALRALCDAHLLAGDGDELAAAAERLRARGEAAGSRRFAAEARWFLAARAGSPHPAELEPLAALVDVAPIAARRARALLGEACELDLLDRAVLRALDARPGGQAIRRIAARAPGGDERAGWGLDTAAQKVWLPGGRMVELATRPLLVRILLAIAARDGRATKEQIVIAAWEQRDYHPVRDDKRLQVAVRKLRLLIEDDPSRAARLVTTPDGYGFGATEPFRLLAPGGEGGA
jgi:hypothetical protein